MTVAMRQPPALETVQEQPDGVTAAKRVARRGLKVLGTISLGLVGIWAVVGAVLFGMFLFAVLVR